MAGGAGSYGASYCDVWKSLNDGLTWSLITPTPAMFYVAGNPRGRYLFATTVMNQNLFAFGGYFNSELANDVW